MEYFIIGIAIGLVFWLLVIIIIQYIRQLKIRKDNKEIIDKYDELDPLVQLLIDKRIILNGTKYLLDIRYNCVYVLRKNILEKYIVDDLKNQKLDEEIRIPEYLLSIFEDFIAWNFSYGLNSLYASSIRIIRDFRKKKKTWTNRA